jgi:hypothetical protein
VIAIADTPHADASDEVHPHAVVALDRGTPVEVQILYPEIANHHPLAQAWRAFGQKIRQAAIAA